MRRREFLAGTGALGAAALGSGLAGSSDANPLTPPRGRINTAFLVSRGATVIDFSGPWEVFQDVHVSRRMPFRLYTVSEEPGPIRCSGGLQIMPDFDLADAPRPHVAVIPAQGGAGERTLEWLKHVHETVDVIMSVCTGAFVLARAGLLDGRSATTHHGFYDRLQSRYPEIEVKRGLRFVEGPKISTAGGLTSGIDLALRVAERYFGRQVVEKTAEYMEYQGTGWKK